MSGWDPRQPSKFGTCTPEERRNCPHCTPKGKQLCKAAAKKLKPGRSPRREKAGDDRPFTPATHEAIRWHLPGRDGLRLTYIFLLSHTSSHSNLIYWAGHRIAERRGVKLNTFREHIRDLKKLKLVETMPRKDVWRGAKVGEEAFYLLPLPKWVTQMNELQDTISNNNITDAVRKNRRKQLEQLQNELLKKLKSPRSSAKKNHK